jgi:mannose PTS system EIIA component
MNDGPSAGAAPAADLRGGAATGPSMIGILIIAHDSLGEGLASAVTHVLGSRPPQFEVLSVAATDDPLMLLPAARELVAQLDTGSGVLVFSDIYGASPCNLVGKLLKPGRVEGVAGVNLPMLVRAITYRARGMETMVKKAISGGCEGVLHMETDPSYAAARS